MFVELFVILGLNWCFCILLMISC